MKKRFFIYIIVSHLLVPIGLILPIHRLKTSPSESVFFINVVDHLEHSSIYFKVLLAIFMAFTLLGIANAIYGIVKKGTHSSIRNAFALGFASAIIGAMYLSTSSYICFLVCAASFLLISYFSIRLMKSEK